MNSEIPVEKTKDESMARPPAIMVAPMTRPAGPIVHARESPNPR